MCETLPYVSNSTREDQTGPSIHSLRPNRIAPAQNSRTGSKSGLFQTDLCRYPFHDRNLQMETGERLLVQLSGQPASHLNLSVTSEKKKRGATVARFGKDATFPVSSRRFFDNGGDWLRQSKRIIFQHVQNPGHLHKLPGHNTDANYGNIAYA